MDDSRRIDPEAAARPFDLGDRPAQPIPAEGTGTLPADQDEDYEELTVRAAEEVEDLGPEAESPEAKTAPLLPEDEARRLLADWEEIQTRFIDQPENAIEDADELVRRALNTLDDLFDRERRRLEEVWEREEEISTEDLRLVERRYGAFFDRLAAV